MLNWLKGNKQKNVGEAATSVGAGLNQTYHNKVIELERESGYNELFSKPMSHADFHGKPQVMLLGQYSTGKSTFIKHLLQREYPGLRIGPEPTTDKFVCVCHGDGDQVIPGNAAAVDPKLPFTGLNQFGANFLTRFECSQLKSEILEGITLIDTPGVLAGDKQRIQRGYDFEGVVKWFAERVDLIILLFDAHKLDISDEFQQVIKACKGNDHKIRVVLNKADRVNTQQLMRVYGALLWSLAKVIGTPEVTRVYIGSFWDQPLHIVEQQALFEREENDLYTDLAILPRMSSTRKLNDFIRRVRVVRALAFLMNYFAKNMPSMFGKKDKQAKMIADLDKIYRELESQFDVSSGDFPPIAEMQSKLQALDFSKIKKVNKKNIELATDAIKRDLPQMLTLIPTEQQQAEDMKTQVIAGAEPSPFAVLKEGGQNEASYKRSEWLSEAPDAEMHRKDFESLGPVNGKLSGSNAKSKLLESKLPSSVLHRIWNLSTINKDGSLTLYEFALCQHFINMKLADQELPPALPSGWEVDPTTSS